jgi:hypothetical protein
MPGLDFGRLRSTLLGLSRWATLPGLSDLRVGVAAEDPEAWLRGARLAGFLAGSPPLPWAAGETRPEVRAGSRRLDGAERGVAPSSDLAGWTTLGGRLAGGVAADLDWARAAPSPLLTRRRLPGEVDGA